MDSPINDRIVSLKLMEQQIRNNYNVKSAKAARASNRDWRISDNFCNCFSGRGDCDTDSNELITSLINGVEAFPRFRKIAAGTL